jgi:CRP-like cAMP-binding protein
MMRELLEHCRDCPTRTLAKGDVVLAENARSGQLFVLVRGMLEVHRGAVEIALVDEPGALFGEMAVLLERPHTASVRAVSEAVVHVIDDAEAFLAARPALAMPIARLLARRLQNVTSYLVDLKQQFADRADHLGMVDEVLESLSHEQGEAFLPAEELPPEPSPERSP